MTTYISIEKLQIVLARLPLTQPPSHSILFGLLFFWSLLWDQPYYVQSYKKLTKTHAKRGECKMLSCWRCISGIQWLLWCESTWRSFSHRKSMDSCRRQKKGEGVNVKSLITPEISISTWPRNIYYLQSFDDLHRLWFILYKERNLILTEKTKMRKNLTPITATDEQRYFKVKRSMAAIKHVLSERQKINNILNKKELPTTVVWYPATNTCKFLNLSLWTTPLL